VEEAKFGEVIGLLTEARDICESASAAALAGQSQAQEALVELRFEIEDGEQRLIRIREILANNNGLV
jgi:hypothetical protein